ncbi:MAG: FAD-dependent oxidoreductase [Sulfuritalea sp.]|nr:FAD-dependent oxidoreductase [Sulfuritalea sp.]
MTASIATSQAILVVGGGISGMTAALEAAECGKQVVLAEKTPTLGGRTALLYRYFPKMCHPTCGLEINLRRLKGNRNIRVMTLTEVLGVSGRRGDYTVTLKVSPRYVTENCTGCGDCAKAVRRGNRQPVRVRPGQDPRSLFAARHGLSAALCDRCVDRWHARRREGQGGLQGRRRRSGDAGGNRRNQGWRGDLGDRLEALRRGEDSTLRLRPLRQRDHQPRIRAPGRSARPHRGQVAAPFGWQGGERHRLHPVRRLARRESPAPLFAHLLHGIAEANPVCPRSLGRG